MMRVSALTFGGTGERPSRLRRLSGISIGLVYLCFPVLEIVTGEVSGDRAVWGGAGLAAFVALYIATVLSPRNFGDPTHLTYWLLGMTTLLGVGLAVAFGGGWLTLPIYLAVIYGMALRPRFSVAGILAMGLAVALIGLLKEHDPGTTLVLVFQVITLGVLFMGVRNTRMLVARLRQAQEEVARLAASEERLRIARDLHDLLGHSLSLIVLKSELAGRLAESGSERTVAEIRDIESVARQALVEVRDAVTGYRQRGLSGELDGARAALEAAGTRLTIRLAGTPLPDALDELLGWAVREGVTNVIRHARATRCEIEVTMDEEVAALKIVDDGRGAASYGPGSGLTGLTERVRAAGGTVSAGPRPTGFALRVTVPHAETLRPPTTRGVR
ncbi:sensor histidine kinase [Streptosporangium sp. NPDC002544]|uniref:sensor histidine kinase n=1 Tax=Streptosporangium sp. NPDC002544 TaxID=3154538 RepID=UPI003319493F